MTSGRVAYRQDGRAGHPEVAGQLAHALAVGQTLPDRGPVGRRGFRRSPQSLACGLGAREAGLGTFTDQVAFHLCDGRDHTRQQATSRGGEVCAAAQSQHADADPLVAQCPDRGEHFACPGSAPRPASSAARSRPATASTRAPGQAAARCRASSSGRTSAPRCPADAPGPPPAYPAPPA